MKTILSIISLLLTVVSYGQTHEIINHDGTKIDANFIKTENNLVYYNTVKSFEQKKISKYAVSAVNDKTNNYNETISEKIQTTKKSDSNKVISLKKSEVAGLKKLKVISLAPIRMKGASIFFVEELGLKRLKEKAASIGSSFIVVESNNINELKATAYTY